MTVRRVDSGDAVALRDVALRSLIESPTAFGRTLEEERRKSLPYYEELAQRWSSSEQTTAFLLHVQDELMGTIGVFFEKDDPSIAWVCAMWVDPACRRRGAGAELLGSAVGWARARGAKAIRAWVADGNSKGRAFWASAGFRASASTQQHPSNPGETETLYVCEVPPN